ncbi:(d)CMP kinase [Alicyclobacillus fodiniaquatilis]|uniref:Cytidylate kinase n=1 Tax=Alicyclobacillus fodiniaquatilis TaxID=1661150 RepID=A0ABW4JL81_9BACL
MYPVSIAIDGPAGAGKSTVARMVAKRLNFLYVDTGAMYRTVAYLCIAHSVDATNSQAIIQMLNQHDVTFQMSDDGFKALVDDVDVSVQLRDPKVSAHVSTVAAHHEVRSRLTTWQRTFAKTQSVVMDGRDIGTVVLPDATIKIFLTADVEERARRRQREFCKNGHDVPLEEIIQAVAERDARDSSREIAPLKAAGDAIQIDSTGKSAERVVDEILSLVEDAHVG